MNTHADKTQENKNTLVPNAVSQQYKNGESISRFVDNRSESIAQRKLQEIASNSNQVKQLSAFQEMVNNSPRAKQIAQMQMLANSAQDQQPVGKKENNIGLPDKLKAGTHFASGREKQMPQEAWHIVQRKQGKVKSTPQREEDVNENDDKGLEIVDVTGNKTASNETADKRGETTLGRPSVASTTVQRRIIKGTKTFPPTWKRIARKGDQELISAANAFWTFLKSIIGSSVDLVKLEHAWNKVAKDPNSNFDIINHKDQLGLEIRERYKRSMQARSSFQSRNNETRTLIRPLMDLDSSFSFAPSARNPMVTRDDMEEIEFDPETPKHKRLATYASTMIMDQYPGGQEAQASLHREGTGMFLSTNVNAVNTEMSGNLKMASDLKNMAANLLMSKGLPTMSREEAMNDIVIRHTLKLYDRIRNYLASDARIGIPPPVSSNLDGMHAEIRIEQVPSWIPSTYFEPTGTKYPCMGCYLYFSSQKIEIGKWMGPLWVTNAALTMQLKELLENGVRLGKIGQSGLEAYGKALAATYSGLPESSRMGHGKTKKGTFTFDHQAESDSELDDDEFDDLQKRVSARNNGVPLSPVWEGTSTWEPPSSAGKEEEPGYDIMGEREVGPEMVQSVADHLKRCGFKTDRKIFVVSGQKWTCYIRCILHHFNKIGDYERVIAEIGGQGIDISSGVVVGETTEAVIQGIIESIVGQTFHVEAQDAQHGGLATTQAAHGSTKVSLLLTGVHFSLLY